MTHNIYSLDIDNIQKKLEQSFKKIAFAEDLDNDSSIQAAVTILLFQRSQLAMFESLPNNESKIHTVLQMRPPRGFHASQISFPGGRREESDGNLLDTAKRELYEEAGITLRTNDLYQMDPYLVKGSNTIVQPFIAFQEGIIHLRPNKSETVYLYLPSIESLINKEKNFTFSYSRGRIQIIDFMMEQDRKNHNIERNNSFESKGVLLGNDLLWGASLAMFQKAFNMLNPKVKIQ